MNTSLDTLVAVSQHCLRHHASLSAKALVTNLRRYCVKDTAGKNVFRFFLFLPGRHSLQEVQVGG
jgi:hypothetical protein